MYLYKKIVMKSLLVLTVGSGVSVADMLDYYMMGVLPSLTVSESETTMGVKKTGQTTSYYPKDDGDYQKGVTPHYTRDDATEVVTDHITGLQWADDANVATVTKPWVTQANYDAGNYFDTSGDTATTYCATLALDGGGWRLPTRKELVGLVDYGRYTPAIDPLFENVANSFLWSSTTRADDSSSGWFVYFYFSYDGGNIKSDSNHVRCVRAGE